jgi:hypothetical protein
LIADVAVIGGALPMARPARVREVREVEAPRDVMALTGDAPPDVVVFVDARRSLEPDDLERVLDAIELRGVDLVIGSRALGPRARERGLWRRVAHGVTLKLIQLVYGQRYTDVGPLRAIRYPALVALGLRERGVGWAVEMQVRAARRGLRVVEVPVSSGLGASPPLGDVVVAVYRALRTIVRYATAR